MLKMWKTLLKHENTTLILNFAFGKTIFIHPDMNIFTPVITVIQADKKEKSEWHEKTRISEKKMN